MFNDEYLTTLTLKLRPLLPRWGLSEGAEIGLLTVSENATFLVSDKMAQRRLCCECIAQTTAQRWRSILS